jgi:hypothetical protein
MSRISSLFSSRSTPRLRATDRFTAVSMNPPVSVQKPSSAAIAYAIAGMSARDELVLKSTLRLLSIRVPQPWVYASSDATVLFLGRHNPGLDPAMAAASSARTVVYVGSSAPGQHQLDLPLNPFQVEALLKLLAGQAQGALPSEPAIAPASPAARGATDLEANTVVSLTRWPSSRVHQQDPARMRLATLLLGRTVTLEQLRAVSALPWEKVLGFARDAQAFGVLKIEAAANVSAEASAISTARAAQPSSPMSTKTPFVPGLLSAIRNRLGSVGWGRR